MEIIEDISGKHIEDWYLVDISKAFLCIFAHESCAKFQGVTLVNEQGTVSYWMHNRLLLGISIASRILRTVIRYILKEEGLDEKVDGFVDNIWLLKVG